MRSAMNNLLCEFVPIDINLLECKYCKFIIQDRDKHKRILCRNQLQNTIANKEHSDIRVKLIKSEKIEIPKTDTSNTTNVISQECTQEQIDNRLAICQTCEYYENNTCLQCGCSLMREKVFNNKLYWSDQSCPIGKWGPIIPSGNVKDEPEEGSTTPATALDGL